MLNIYPWQNNEWQRVLQMQRQQRLPHALLLRGSEGIGLRQFALSLAMQILCLSNDNKEACGNCNSCRLFQAGNHPDLSLVEPDGPGKQIKIAQIRELIHYVSLKSFLSHFKIVLLEPADAMNRAAANTLLKTLEEPPGQSILLLLTYHPLRLPVTIRSRCQRIDFRPSYDPAVLNWLEEKLPEKSDISADLLLRLSQGLPLRALSLLEDGYFTLRRQLLEDLTQARRKKGVDVVQIAAAWQGHGCENVLVCLLQLMRDMIRVKLFGRRENLSDFDAQENLQNLIKALDLSVLIHYYDFIQAKYEELVGPMNYNPLHILEQVLLEYRKIK